MSIEIEHDLGVIPKLYFPDITYESEDIVAKAEYQARLQKSIDGILKPVNIGSGADYPAFVMEILGTPLLLAALGLFFSGKKINENLDAWVAVGKKIAQLKKYSPYLNKAAAAVLVIYEYLAKTENKISSFKLLSVRILDSRFTNINSEEVSNFSATPETADTEENISQMIFVFEIEFDLEKVTIIVQSTKIVILK